MNAIGEMKRRAVRLKNEWIHFSGCVFRVAAVLILNATVAFADSVKLDNIPVLSGIDNTQITVRHNSFGQEGFDNADSTLFPSLVNPKALRLWTNPYGTNLLSIDTRPTNSMTAFVVNMTTKDNSGTGVSTTNYIQFTIPIALDYGRKDYKVEVDVWGSGSSNAPFFSQTYGLQNIISNLSAKTDAWVLTNISNNVTYGRVVMTPLTNLYGLPAQYRTVTVMTAYGTATPATLTNVPSGSVITQQIGPVVVSNPTNAATRFKLIGPQVIGNDFTPLP